MEALQVQAVEPVHMALQAGQVLPPAVHSGAGAVHPDGLENGLPELFHRLAVRAAGKDLPGPGGDGDGADAPGDGIAHGQLPVLPEGLAAGALGAGNPVRIHAHQILRIPGGDMEEGRALAETVYERHSVLSQWLIRLGVTPETAIADACKMEHDMSEESFEAVKAYLLKNPS